jgi:uncharacterized protein (DUF1697 family)
VARLIAFLRAVNVGGRTLPMVRLRALAGTLGFANAETFIASGNLIVDGRARDARSLERRLEGALLAELGYEVPVFVRTDAELAAAAVERPWPPAEVTASQAFAVGFLKAPLDAGAARRLQALASAVDAFRVSGREVYWLCRVRQSESAFSNAVFERRVGVAATWRSMTTVSKLAAKYPPARS